MEHRWFPPEVFLEVQKYLEVQGLVSTVPGFVPYIYHIVVTSISCIETLCPKVRLRVYESHCLRQ